MPVVGVVPPLLLAFLKHLLRGLVRQFSRELELLRAFLRHLLRSLVKQRGLVRPRGSLLRACKAFLQHLLQGLVRSFAPPKFGGAKLRTKPDV